MPFKSKSQVRKFYALKRQGKMTQSEIDKWMSETGGGYKNLPEKIAFVRGFLKHAQLRGIIHDLNGKKE